MAKRNPNILKSLLASSMTKQLEEKIAEEALRALTVPMQYDSKQKGHRQTWFYELFEVLLRTFATAHSRSSHSRICLPFKSKLDVE